MSLAGIAAGFATGAAVRTVRSDDKFRIVRKTIADVLGKHRPPPSNGGADHGFGPEDYIGLADDDPFIPWQGKNPKMRRPADGHLWMAFWKPSL